MIAVTGATGHVGNVLVRELLARGETVRAVIPSADDVRAINGLPIEHVPGDVRDEESLARAFKSADTVYHLAAIIDIAPKSSDLLTTVNVLGTRNVVNACRRAGVRRLVYTSSIEAVPVMPGDGPITEKVAFDPELIPCRYGRSKAQATLEVLAGVKGGLDAVIVCPTGIIGPLDFRGSLMGFLLGDAARGKLRAYIDGAFDFVDVRDVVAALVSAGERGGTGEVYIASGHQVSVPELIGLIEEVAGVRGRRIKIPFWLADLAAHFTPAISRMTGKPARLTHDSIHILNQGRPYSHAKATSAFGYAPRPLRKTIEDTLKWMALPVKTA